jgi:DNA-binding LytR/AlgR family response regulator
MLRALVVDDEAPARSELRFLLDEIGGVEVVGEAAGAAEALQLIGALSYDVVFLDIEMPGMSGVQLAEALAVREHRPAIVFVTAYSTHAVRAFEVAATDYLVKPVQVERLRQALDRTREVPGPLEAPPAPPRSADGARAATVPVQKDGHTLLIATDDILYAAAYDNYSRLLTEEGRFLCTLSLRSLQEKLTPQGFMRAHRRFLVNTAHVVKVSPEYGGGLLLTLDDQAATCIPVSRRRAPHVKKTLGL